MVSTSSLLSCLVLRPVVCNSVFILHLPKSLNQFHPVAQYVCIICNSLETGNRSEIEEKTHLDSFRPSVIRPVKPRSVLANLSYVCNVDHILKQEAAVLG